jgi:hypothetical protein
MWYQLDAEDAVAGGYALGVRHQHTGFERYLACAKKNAVKWFIFDEGFAIWGRSEIEGV